TSLGQHFQAGLRTSLLDRAYRAPRRDHLDRMRLWTLERDLELPCRSSSCPRFALAWAGQVSRISTDRPTRADSSTASNICSTKRPSAAVIAGGRVSRIDCANSSSSGSSIVEIASPAVPGGLSRGHENPASRY